MSHLTLHDWFCMRDDRSSFRPRLPQDASLIFCHDTQIRTEILESIEMRFATRDPIKMVICGDWGVGKTHLTHHICWWLATKSSEFPARPVIIEIGDITKKSRFDDIVRPFLDAIGLGTLIKLVHDYRGKEPSVTDALRRHGVSSHVADAFNKILLASPGYSPAELVSQAFEYLKGRKPAGGAGAGFGQPLEQSQEFVDVLTSVGIMYHTVHGHRLLFIADEAARLENVEADEAARSHWVNANKLIFDDKNQAFGFIYTVSGKHTRELPQAIWDPQIQNRLGDKNTFVLSNLASADVEQYLRRLVDAFVDRDRVTALVGTEIEASFQWDKYPFTSDAYTAFIDYFNRTQENAKPRDISAKLDELGFTAGKKKIRLIDSDCLEIHGI